MRRSEIAEAVFHMLESFSAELDVEPVDVEFVREAGHDFLRVYIDRDGGVRMEDCEAVSKRLGPILDDVDIIPGHYYLEVSSPGIERTLKKDREFRHFTGRQVEIALFQPLPQGKRFWGTLLGLDNGIVSIELDSGQVLAVPREKVAKARLVLPKRGVDSGEPGFHGRSRPDRKGKGHQ